jgi:hypothetical protein
MSHYQRVNYGLDMISNGYRKFTPGKGNLLHRPHQETRKKEFNSPLSLYMRCYTVATHVATPKIQSRKWQHIMDNKRFI